jgi:hypothetical protein
LIDDKAESAVFGEKSQAMSAVVRIGAAFGQARDLAGLHLLAKLWQRQPEALGDHGCLDLNDAIADFNRFHGSSDLSRARPALPLLHRSSDFADHDHVRRSRHPKYAFKTPI